MPKKTFFKPGDFYEKTCVDAVRVANERMQPLADELTKLDVVRQAGVCDVVQILEHVDKVLAAFRAVV